MAPPKPRLTDRQPLSDPDPAPRGPQAVRDEIKHLNSVKDELNKQADRLKGIRDDDELRGKYATTLKEEAEALEGRLRDVSRSGWRRRGPAPVTTSPPVCCGRPARAGRRRPPRSTGPSPGTGPGRNWPMRWWASSTP
ncbi:hypothetical protein B9W68_18400 [Streptomyces sp. CS227]|uniref:hypothetical protein n=1 Tax=Streptomyces sp. CS227 TaxID=1982763 RepID=UPI000B411C52|nr:hypothetical protein [Streptomyces sp. CS227]OWA06434.1 hypothetical protein B9W68_18400 [Streptomyces sp. CS227]